MIEDLKNMQQLLQNNGASHVSMNPNIAYDNQ